MLFWSGRRRNGRGGLGRLDRVGFGAVGATGAIAALPAAHLPPLVSIGLPLGLLIRDRAVSVVSTKPAPVLLPMLAFPFPALHLLGCFWSRIGDGTGCRAGRGGGIRSRGSRGSGGRRGGGRGIGLLRASREGQAGPETGGEGKMDDFHRRVFGPVSGPTDFGEARVSGWGEVIVN